MAPELTFISKHLVVKIMKALGLQAEHGRLTYSQVPALCYMEPVY